MMRFWSGRLGGMLLLVGLVSGTAIAGSPEAMSEVRGRKGMVVSVCRHASRAGLEVLKAGGNAVDAAVAVEFALAVTWPEAGNIGGGGFMMIHPAEGGEVVCVDYREKAPGAASETLFDRDDGRHTHKIVGVPGTVAGMALAHRRFGRLDWTRVLQPAIDLAEEGFEVDRALASSINRVLQFESVQQGEHHRELRRVYGKPGETEWKPGDRLRLPDLAGTLRRIRNSGRAGFYGGETARLLVEEMKRGKGLISLEDLAGYRAKVRPAVHGSFRGFDVYGPPLPSSGGICIVEMLNVLETFDLRAKGRFSPETLHLMAETMKRAFRDRAIWLGDSDFVSIPPHLVTKAYGRRVAESIDPARATGSEELARTAGIELAPESPETTHFSVIDGKGMAVSNTTTLEASWGARIVVKGAGFVLNNEMGDFNWLPGHTDREGRIGTLANRIAPGKRMLSSQSPAVVARDGKVVLVTGSPGGRTIINTSLQMILNVVEFGMPLDEAMRAPRIHHQWLPDVLVCESFDRRQGPEVVKELRARGHTVRVRGNSSHQGDAHSIAVDSRTGVYHGVADWRRNGSARGF